MAGSRQGTTTQVVPPGTYGPGARVIASSPIPLGLVDFDLDVDTSLLTDPAVRVEVCFDLSLDGGNSWNGNGVIGDCYAGAGVDGRATPSAKMSVGRGLPEPANPNRRFRGKMTIIGGSLQTSANLTTYTS